MFLLVLSLLLGGSDDCATPQPIAGAGVFAFDNSSATTGTVGQSDNDCKAFGSTAIDNDVWFEWTADVSGAARLSTCGATVDTKVAAWQGIPCPIDGTVIACNDDACGLQSQMTWPVRAGQCYILQIGNFPGAAGGTGSFEIETTAATKLATYEAGLEGLPPTAPDPRSQGWTLVDPSGGAVGLSDVSPDGVTGLNAWQIEDDVSAPGGRAHYEQLPDELETTAAWVLGFELELELRFVAGADDDFFMDLGLRFRVGNSGPRYELVFRPDGPDLIATYQADGSTYTLAGANDGRYHRIGIRTVHWSFWPRQLLEFDGVAIAELPFVQMAGSNPGLRWGTSSELGTATVNVHSVSFSLIEPEVDILFGDTYCTAGTGTACPCDNVAELYRGCANSTGVGAGVFFTGNREIDSGDHSFDAIGVVPGQAALLFAGEEPVAGGEGAQFGDGLRCAGTNVVRLGVAVPDAAGSAEWGPDLQPIGGWLAGDVRYFQVWYRDPIGTPCGSGFNLSSAYRVGFLP